MHTQSSPRSSFNKIGNLRLAFINYYELKQHTQLKRILRE